MKLMELMAEVDKFVERHCKDVPSERAMKAEVLDLLQKALEIGEGKDQNKITGIATGILKQFFPFGKKD